VGSFEESFEYLSFAAAHPGDVISELAVKLRDSRGEKAFVHSTLLHDVT
jgi:hypothetical protein